jgi:DNA repair exonuclease SbcCD ATPase subunit
MKPVPNIVLSALLVALCGLCGWQWHRESQLRVLAATQHDQLNLLTDKRNTLEARVKAADAEVLRITASLAELRANSVSKEVHAEVVQANAMLRETILKQNTAITQQNERLAKQNASIQQANENLKKLATERDDLAKRLNEVTTLYNKIIKPDAAPKVE